jgi:Arc/MetJ-type ribon-helix-helix transcriptional regulator
VEIEKSEKRDTSILTIRVTPEHLEFIDRAIEASEAKYTTRADLVRDAIEYFSRHIVEGEMKATTLDEPNKSTKKDLEHDANVEEALELINELEDTDIEAIEELASEAKEEALSKSVWSDDRVQKAMRKTLRDEVYPAGFWDGIRKFRKRKSREYVEVLRRSLAIPRSVAKQLVEDPSFRGEEYEEWS